MNFKATRYILVLFLFLLFSGKSFSQPTSSFTSTDRSGCPPHTVHFQNTSIYGAGVVFLWEFGDPNSTGTSDSLNPSHSYTASGQYTVTLTVTDATGSNVKVETNFVIVFNTPNANYTTISDTVCSGVPLIFNDATTLGDAPLVQWQWSFNDGSSTDSLSGSSASHTYNNVTTLIKNFSPVLTVRDGNGCKSIHSGATLSVLPQPVAAITFVANSCTFPSTVTFTNTGQQPHIHNWNFDDPGSGANNTSTLDAPSHTYAAAGSYTVTLVNGVNGCSASASAVVNLVPPVAAFSVPDTIVCLGSSVPFTNMSTPTPAGTSPQWTFGDGSPASFAIDPFHTYNTPGTYQVTLTARIGTCTSTATKTIYVPPLPLVQITSPDQQACDTPFAVTFNDPTSNLTAWHWNFNDPSSGALDTSNVQNPVHTYANFGSYNVTLTVTDNHGCTNTDTYFNYILIQAPQLNFTVEDSGCVGDIFNYTANVISPADPVVTDYTWNFGDGTGNFSVATPNTTHQFNTVGIFDVTLTITTASGCTATLTKQAYARVGTKPIADMVDIVTTICFKGNISFQDSSYPAPITGWDWDFGDGGGSTSQNPSHQYNLDTSGTADPFDVTLIVYYNGCKSDPLVMTDIITVLGPIPNFAILYNCVNPDSVNFTNLTGDADIYSWNFGDPTSGASNTSSLTDPIHIFTDRGQYNVVLTATDIDNACTVDSTLSVNITHIQAVITSASLTQCYPAQLNFSGTNSQDGVAFSWNFGDPSSGFNNTSSGSNPSHIYNAPGLYTVTLIATDIHGCKDSTTAQVNMTGPIAGFTGSPLAQCHPTLNVTFHDASTINGSAITQWDWNFGSGAPSTVFVDNVMHPYTSAGIFTVILTVTDGNGCTDRDTMFNYVTVTDPIAGISMPDTIGCRNTPKIFTGTAGIAAPPVTYSWDFGDGQTTSGTTNPVSHSYIDNGSYTVTLTVSDNTTCTSTTSRQVLIHTTSAHFTRDATAECVLENGIKKARVHVVYHSDSLEYTTNANYNWDLTVFQDANSPLHDFTYDYNVPPGSYDATLILTNDLGCTDTYNYPGAVVVPGPTGSFSFTPDSGCSPLSVNFTGTSTGTNLYSWDFGDGSTISGTSNNLQTHVYSAVGTFTPQFYLGFNVSNDVCYIPVALQGDVKVTSLITVNILESSIYVTYGERDTLNVSVINPFGGPPYTYNWTPANMVINGPTPESFLATTTGVDQYYYVAVPYGTQGCSGIDSVLVRFKMCESLLKIPNVFTPDDGNSENNTYHIKDLCIFEGFYIRIYNRWGRIIFESADPAFEWDGTTTGGSKASDGVYYYVINARTQQLHGYIDLIRSKR